MRIAYVCADLGVTVDGRSGSSVHVRELVRALGARGAEVTLFTVATADAAARRAAGCAVVGVAPDAILQDFQRRLTKELRAAGRSPTRAAETAALLLNQPLLEALARHGRFDLVYERHSLWSVAGLQFARRAGVPYFLELNAPLAAQQQEYRALDMPETARAIEDQVLQEADLVVATSDALRAYAHARGVSRRKVRVVPCGVSAHLFAAPPRARARERADEFVVGFLGTLKPWHGVDLLLDAFRRLRALSEQYRLLIVGDGPLAGEVRSFCAAHRLDAAVTLAGGVDHADVPRYLARMDAGVAPYPSLPSFYFSPLKVWEYAAAGVPIVASAGGELPRLFPHRGAALLHEPGRVGKIVSHIERLRRDPSLGRRLARRARAVAKRHTWNRLAARLLTLAARAVGTAAARPRRRRT